MALRRELDEQANIAAAAARAAAEANLRAEDATRRLAENVGDVVGTVNPSNPRTNFSTNPFDDFSANPFDTSVDRVAGTPAGSVYRPSPSTSAGHASSSGSARSLASRGSRGSSRRISTGSSGGGGFGSVVDARESYTSGVFLDEEMSADGSVSFDLSPSAGSVASGSAGSTRGGARAFRVSPCLARASLRARVRTTAPRPSRAGFAADFQTGAKETGVKDAARASALARLEAARAARKAAADAERREVERQASTRAARLRRRRRGGSRRASASDAVLEVVVPEARRTRAPASPPRSSTVRASPAPWPSPPSRRQLRPVAERRLEPISSRAATRNTETETETASGTGTRASLASPPPAPSGTGTDNTEPNGVLSPLSALANRTLDDGDVSFCDDASSRRLEHGDAERRDSMATRVPPAPELSKVDRSFDRSVSAAKVPPKRSSSSAASAWRSAFRSAAKSTTTTPGGGEGRSPKKLSMVSRAIAYLTPRKKKKKAPKPRWQ